MTDATADRDDRRARARDERGATDGRSPTLESIVVRYEERPNRRTIAPREASDPERLTTWLTADADAFVDLDERR